LHKQYRVDYVAWSKKEKKITDIAKMAVVAYSKSDNSQDGE
jgi:hypothetical protein